MSDNDLDYKNVYKQPASGALEKIKAELALRQDNEHVGSGFGGNPTEYFFLLSHNIKTKLALDEKPSFTTESGDVVFYCPTILKIKEARQELTTFVNNLINAKMAKVVTEDQLYNVSWLKDQPLPSLEIKLLIKALETIKEVKPWLEDKNVLLTQISKSFLKEKEEIEKLFLRDLGLPENSFELEEEEMNKIPYGTTCSQYGILSSMLSTHPVWKVKLEEISQRKKNMHDNLFSSEDSKKLNLVLDAFPAHIALAMFRSQIGIQLLVGLSLDEYYEKGFSRVNNITK